MGTKDGEKNKTDMDGMLALQVPPMPGKSSRALLRTRLGRAFCFYLVAMGATGRSLA